jgi:hypothetical protein
VVMKSSAARDLGYCRPAKTWIPRRFAPRNDIWVCGSKSLHATSYPRLISSNICGSIFPPLMTATLTVVLGSWS